jgi:hypothetical protein
MSPTSEIWWESAAGMKKENSFQVFFFVGKRKVLALLRVAWAGYPIHSLLRLCDIPRYEVF